MKDFQIIENVKKLSQELEEEEESLEEMQFYYGFDSLKDDIEDLSSNLSDVAERMGDALQITNKLSNLTRWQVDNPKMVVEKKYGPDHIGQTKIAADKLVSELAVLYSHSVDIQGFLNKYF